MENEYYKRYEPFFGEWRIKRFIGAGSYGRVFEIERGMSSTPCTPVRSRP